MNYPNILEQNIYDKGFKRKFLVIGSCLPKTYPEIVKKFEKEWGSVFTFCLEQFHYNQLIAKLFDILAIGNTQKIGFLTVDGSPHCVQMHFASKYLRRGLKIQTIDYQHYVIRKDGKVFKIKPELIDRARDFSGIGEEITSGKRK
ncbi:MAG: hypothetical protein Q8N98_04915 [bacterium]|nr:hypothetical protein [bacterium]